MTQDDATKKNRIAEIDFLRGLCIFLMIMDHLMLITLKFDHLIWGYDVPNNAIQVIKDISIQFYDGKFAINRYYFRILIVSFFLFISGISCSFSKNNKKRFIKMSFMALLISIITYIISSNTKYYCLIEWGIFHCYAICLLTYMVILKLNGNLLLTSSLLFSIIALFIWVFEPRISHNLFMPLGIPAVDFSYSVEYFPVLKWIAVFLFGSYIGHKFYLEKNQKLSC